MISASAMRSSPETAKNFHFLFSRVFVVGRDSVKHLPTSMWTLLIVNMSGVFGCDEDDSGEAAWCIADVLIASWSSLPRDICAWVILWRNPHSKDHCSLLIVYVNFSELSDVINFSWSSPTAYWWQNGIFLPKYRHRVLLDHKLRHNISFLLTFFSRIAIA